MKNLFFNAARLLALIGIISTAMAEPSASPVVPPKVISQQRPQYPAEMRRAGIEGEVTLSFEIDPTGSVKNVMIVSSSNPVFDEHAFKAVREWKFHPATRDGKAITYRTSVPVIFTLNGSERGGANGYRIDTPKDQSKLPLAFRFDTPPKLRTAYVPVYPYELRRDKIKGNVQAAIMIDLRGRVSDIRVIKADTQAFGQALVAALVGFEFDPALKEGKPVPHVLNFEQDFNFRDLPDAQADRLLEVEKKSPKLIIPYTSLDTPPKAILRRQPVFPVGVGPNVTAGEAEIECLIDVDGRVRLPRVVGASDQAFGYAAVQAANGWWFEPPLAGGKPVITRTRLPFKFSAK